MGAFVVAIAALAAASLLLAAGWARAATGDLSEVQCLVDSSRTLAGCTPTTGILDFQDGLVVSPDGSSVYATTDSDNTTLVDALARGAGGSLTFAQCVADSQFDVPPACGSLNGLLDQAPGLAVSPDGAQVYLAGNQFKEVQIFGRSPNGALSDNGCVGSYGIGPPRCTVGTYGLRDPYQLVVSPDGRDVYVTSVESGAGGTLEVLSRAANGSLTPEECYSDPASGAVSGCSSLAGLDHPVGIAISPDGQSVYVAGQSSHDVAIFNRAADGTLSDGGCIAEAGAGPARCATTAPGLSAPSAVAVSPDGHSVYVTDSSGNTLSAFTRAAGGTLTPQACLASAGTATAGCASTAAPMLTPQSIAVASDGASVYVAAYSSSAVDDFTRAAGGSLTYSGCLGASGGGCPTTVPGLSQPTVVTASPDGTNLYAAGLYTIAVLHRQPAPAGGSSTGSGTGTGVGSGPGSSAPTLRTHTVLARVGALRFSLRTSLPSCLARTARLRPRLSLTGAAASLRFVRARLFLDRGVGHVHHRTRHVHGHTKHVTTISYTADKTVTRLPAQPVLRLVRLRRGRHTLTVEVSVRQTVHHRSRILMRRMRQQLRICS